MAEANIPDTPVLNQTMLNQSYDPLLLIQQQTQQINQLQNMVQSMLNRQVVIPTNNPERGPRKEHFDLIPQFDGSPQRLHFFLEVTQRLYDKFYNELAPDSFENFTLISGIKSKIISPAADHVISADSFDEIKNALLNAYTDKRDHFTLVIELVNLRQSEGETAFKFHEKVLKISNLIAAYLENHNVPHANILLENYKKLALRCFLLHLKEPLGSLMRTRQPDDLSTALSWLTNDYQHLMANNRGYNNSRNFPPKNGQNSSFQNQKAQLNKTGTPNNVTYRPQQQQNRFPQNQNSAPSRNLSQTVPNNSKPPVQGQNPTNQTFAPRASSTMKPTPMSWRTSNTNFHNMENTGENVENPNPDPDQCEEQYEEYQEPQTEGDDCFLEEPSLENPHLT